MSDSHKNFDAPENVACVEQAMSGMDFQHVAEEMNRATGGCLDARAAENMTRLVGLAAMRSRGRAVIVAGVGAQVEGNRLILFLGAEIGSAEVPEILEDKH